MTGADDGSLDALRQQFGITTTTGLSTTTTLPGPSLAGMASSGSNGGTVPSAGGNGASMDALRRQFGITTAPPAAPSGPSGPRPDPQQAAAGPTASKGGGGLGGFLGKVAHEAEGAVTGLPGAVVHLGSDLGKSVYNTGRTLAAPVLGEPGYLKVHPGESFTDYATREFPVLSDVAKPTIGTGRTLAGIAQEAGAPGHGFANEMEQRYGQNPLGSALSDVAGAAIVLGPLAKLADVAGAGAGATSGLAKAADITSRVAAAPVKPFEAVLRGADLPETIAGRALPESLAGRHLPGVTDIPAVANTIERVKATGAAADLRSRLFAQPLAQTAGEVTKAFVPLDKLGPDEQAAATLNARTELGLSAPALAKLAPAEQDALIGHLADQRGVTPQAMNLHLASLAGDTPASLAEAAGPVSELRAKMQEDALAGRGFTPDGQRLSPAQSGFEPLGKEGLSPADIQDAPARLRPMLIAAHDTAAWLAANGHADIAAEIMPTLGAVRRAGLDAEHVIGGSDTKPAKTPGARGGIPGPVKNGAQYERFGNTTEYTAHGQMGLALNRALQTVRNEFPQKLADPGTRPASIAEAGTIDASGAPEGHPLAAALADQGRVPWDPTKGTGSAAFPQGAGNVAPGDVTRSTLTMPKPLYDALTRQEAKIPGGNTFEKIEQVIRKSPLLLSPTYHVRIATSNAALLGLQGDLTANPIELARRIKETARLLRSGEAPRALIRGGLFGDEQALADARRAAQGGGNAATNAIAAPVRLGQKAGAVIDNLSRVMAYVGEKAKGYRDEEAVTRANKVIGDYSKLSPVERAYIRRIIPIYPWLKQVATVAARVGADHPATSLFLLHAGQVFDQNQPGGLPAFLRGALPIGGNKLVPTDLANPFAVFTSPPGGFVNPMIKGPLEVATGMNPAKWAQITRPTYGPGGAPQPPTGPLWKNPAEAGYVLSRLNPISRFVTDIRNRPVLRYGTGEAKVDAHTGRETATGYPSPLLSLLGIPAAEKGPTAQQQAKTAKTNASADRNAARAYQRSQRASKLPPLKQP